MLQLESLHPRFDEKHLQFGDSTLQSIYGAGCTNSPEAVFVFMNPTARNISSVSTWSGIRAPWLGTKQIWNLFYEANLLSKENYDKTQEIHSHDWDFNFCNSIYQNLADHDVYVTNLAKCTQLDARPLRNEVFREYLPLFFEEVEMLKPKRIILFGNQVSSIVLGKSVKISEYLNNTHEDIKINNLNYKMYPVFYPVGQGRRNLYLAIERIANILSGDVDD